MGDHSRPPAGAYRQPASLQQPYRQPHQPPHPSQEEWEYYQRSQAAVSHALAPALNAYDAMQAPGHHQDRFQERAPPGPLRRIPSSTLQYQQPSSPYQQSFSRANGQMAPTPHAPAQPQQTRAPAFDPGDTSSIIALYGSSPSESQGDYRQRTQAVHSYAPAFDRTATQQPQLGWGGTQPPTRTSSAYPSRSASASAASGHSSSYHDIAASPSTSRTYAMPPTGAAPMGAPPQARTASSSYATGQYRRASDQEPLRTVAPPHGTERESNPMSADLFGRIAGHPSSVAAYQGAEDARWRHTSTDAPPPRPRKESLPPDQSAADALPMYRPSDRPRPPTLSTSTLHKPEIVTTPPSQNSYVEPDSARSSPSRLHSVHSSLTAVVPSPISRLDSTPSVRSELAPYLNIALLSHVAMHLKDVVPRGVRRKGEMEHPRSFDGRDIVSTIQQIIEGQSDAERRYALAIARSLQQALWFAEVDWDDALLRDAPGKAYVFVDEQRDGGFLDAEEGLTEVPTAVLTNFTACYSPLCGRATEGGYSCYSATCPNRTEPLYRQASLISQASYSSERLADTASDWTTLVSDTLDLSLVDKSEIKRQNLIHELIQTEEHYCEDLEFVQQAFEEPLRAANPPIIPRERLDQFLSAVLLNMARMAEYSRSFVNALKERGERDGPFVTAVGDLFLQAALAWSQDYIDYTVNSPFAELACKEEKTHNTAFNSFLMEFSKLPGAKRRGFDQFQTRIPFRGMRYPLLLEQIYKSTPEGSQDRSWLEQAIAVIKQQSLESDERITVSKSKVALRQYQQSLVGRSGEAPSLDLDHDDRRVFMSGTMYRKSEGSGFNEWSESHVILLDHYFLVTKASHARDGRQLHIVHRRPIAIELLRLRKNSFTEPSVPRGGGFHFRGGGGGGGQALYPILLNQAGRYGSSGPTILYVETPQIRLEWEKRFKDAIASRTAALERDVAVRLVPISEHAFGSGTPTDPSRGRPTCSVPLRSSEGQELVIVGCAQGLFIGFRGRPRSMMQVVHLAGITQCSLLEDFGYLIVLANKVLIAYSIEALVPSGSRDAGASRAPQRLSGQKDVLFFRAGKIGDDSPRTLVIYVKRSAKESVFRALEPLERSRGGGGHRFLGLGSSKSDSFRTFKDFFIPSEAYAMQFLKSKLAIVCRRGVEVMSLDTLKTMTIPDFGQSRDAASMALARRCEESRTLGMFRLEKNEFLLCYEDFAFVCDQHGEPLRNRYKTMIDWESRPVQVAYRAPYVFAFSDDMIEVRHASTGRLVQIVLGTAIRCTFEGNESSFVHVSMQSGSQHILYELQPV